MQDKYIGRILHNCLGHPIKIVKKENGKYICENLITREEEIFSEEEIKRSW